MAHVREASPPPVVMVQKVRVLEGVTVAYTFSMSTSPSATDSTTCTRRAVNHLVYHFQHRRSPYRIPTIIITFDAPCTESLNI